MELKPSTTHIVTAAIAAGVAVVVTTCWRRHREPAPSIVTTTSTDAGSTPDEGCKPDEGYKPSRSRRPSAEPLAEADVEDDDVLLHGRAKHDMTPEMLARRQHTDPLVSLMLDLIDKYALPEACAIAEDLIADHLEAVQHRTEPVTELSTLAPRLVSNEFGRLWQPLHLREALIDYDAEAHVTCRQYVPATFRELRNICNLAQVRPAVAAPLQLLTFDGDKTLYPDRETLSADSPLVPLLLELLRRGVALALVTAVGFDEAGPYEERLSGLLKALTALGAPDALCGRLYVVGGQCNYLARCLARQGAAVLEMVPGKEWRLPEMQRWQTAQLQRLLDVAQRALLDGAARMHLAGKVKLVRKTRAVGLLYEGEMHRTTTLMLDELAVHARQAVREEQRTNRALASMPFCAFNGGRDVFVDVGSKDLGIASLQRMVGATPQSTLHIGDQFTLTGNDLLARRACGTLWVDSPEETAVLLAYTLRMFGVAVARCASAEAAAPAAQ